MGSRRDPGCISTFWPSPGFVLRPRQLAYDDPDPKPLLVQLHAIIHWLGCDLTLWVDVSGASLESWVMSSWSLNLVCNSKLLPGGTSAQHSPLSCRAPSTRGPTGGICGSGPVRDGDMRLCSKPWGSPLCTSLFYCVSPLIPSHPGSPEFLPDPSCQRAIVSLPSMPPLPRGAE